MFLIFFLMDVQFIFVSFTVSIVGLVIAIILLPRKKYPYSDFFWSVFSRNRTEYGDILPISSYSVQIRKNTDQKNSEYGHVSRNDCHWVCHDLGCLFQRLLQPFLRAVGLLGSLFCRSSFRFYPV